MKLDEWPPDIEAIFKKPGCNWTDKECKRIINSLWSKERLPKLLTLTRHHLGPPPPSPDDAEDALRNFCISQSQADYLDKLTSKYDPQKGRFLTYFTTALKRFLHKQGAEIRERLSREDSLVSAQHAREDGLDKDSESIELILLDDNLNSQPDLLSEYEEAINCINQLPTNERKVFIAYHFKPYSYADIATDMKITEANARQLCHRARVQVTKCLEQHF